MAISKEQVFQACNEIFSQGKTPRIEGVRSILGSGSYSTIGKYLKEWKEQNPDSANVSTSEIPQDLHNAAYEAIKPVIALIWDKASESVDSDRLKTLELENERYIQQTQELAGLRTAYQALLQRNEQLNQDLALARAGVGVDNVITVSELQSELEALRQESDELINQSASLTREMQEALTNNTILQNRVDTLEVERKQLQERNQELTIANGNLEALQRELTEAKQTIEALQKQRGGKGEQMGTLNGEVIYLAPEIWQAIEAERQAFRAEIEALKASPSAIAHDHQEEVQAIATHVQEFAREQGAESIVFVADEPQPATEAPAEQATEKPPAKPKRSRKKTQS